MKKTRVGEGESPAALSARLGAPVCMILRANGLFSPAWLLPGREIAVPGADCCEGGCPNPCPRQALHVPAAARVAGHAVRLERDEDAASLLERLEAEEKDVSLLSPLPGRLRAGDVIFVREHHGGTHVY